MLFGKKKEKTPPLPDFSQLVVDVHSHILPGLDDGSKSFEDSAEIIKGLISLGYKKVITTPHNQADLYINTPNIIAARLNELQDYLVTQNINIEIEAASEYFFDYEFLSKIRNKELLTFGNNYVLFELSTILPPVNFETLVFEMQMAGYRPVLAHPERYSYWHRNFDYYSELNDKGVLLQVNLHSFHPQIAPPIRNTAEKLAQNKLVSLAGSDTHSYSNIEILRSLYTNPNVYKLLNENKLLNSQL